MKAIVNFKNGNKSLVIVNLSYSKGGIHYYSLTTNKLNTFINFVPNETKLYTGEEISNLTYVMD